jgi:hypothetical protein
MEFGTFAPLLVPRAERTAIRYSRWPEHHLLDEYRHMPGQAVHLSYHDAVAAAEPVGDFDTDPMHRTTRLREAAAMASPVAP